VNDELFDLLSARFLESLGAAEIDRVGFDQEGIELVLPDELTEAVPELRLCLPAIPVDRLRRKLLPARSMLGGAGPRSKLFHGAHSDAVSFAKGAIDGTCLGDPHFSPADQSRHIGRVSVAVTDESFARGGLVHDGFECPT